MLLQYFDKTADETAPDAVFTALQAALPDNLIVLDKSAAEDKDAVVVTRDTATRLNVKSIADLAPQCPNLVFGGAPEFQTRPDGIPASRRRTTAPSRSSARSSRRPADRRGVEER